jgi:hypothetical protein
MELLILDNVGSWSNNRYSNKFGFQELLPQIFPSFADFQVTKFQILALLGCAVDLYIFQCSLIMYVKGGETVQCFTLCGPSAMQLVDYWPPLWEMLNISCSAFFWCKNYRLVWSMSVAYRGRSWGGTPLELPKALQNCAKLNSIVKTFKITEFRTPTPPRCSGKG